MTTQTTILPVVLPALGDIPGPVPASRRVLFAAAFHRPENAEGALWFLDEVWPHVRGAVPGATLRLAGSRPPNRLVSRAGYDVEVTGYLPSMATAYANVACVVVPLRRGAGVKFKAVEAVRAGFPVVSTPVGAEGLWDVTKVEPTVTTADPLCFAEGVSRVLLEKAPGDVERSRAMVSVPDGQDSLEQHFQGLRALLDQRPRAGS